MKEVVKKEIIKLVKVENPPYLL